jgi:hypothetical protein
MDPEASRGDEVFQEFFRAYGEAMQVVDGSIQVFTFADEAMAQGAASGVSSDASEIKGVDGSISMPMWIGTPHFYINGATITIYVGENVSIAGMLADRAGEQFAVGSGVGIVGGFLPPAIEPVPPTPPKIGIKPGYVTREAPIESASVVVLESLPAQYRAHVVFGLPNGCLEYAGSPVSVDSHGAHIQLLLQRPEGDIACTDDYRQDKVAIDLHGPFISGQKYDFCVNGTFVGQDDSGSGPIMAPQDPDQYKTEVAPIESVSVQMVGEGGLDYAAVILVGLPNGCYQLGGWSASRSPEDVTRITVETRIPNQDGVACTEIYRTTELKVPLKGGFAAGTMYTLDVNGTVIEFEGRDEGRDTEAATSEPLPLAPALGATELVIATVLDMEVVPSATSRSGLAVRVTSELPHSHAMLGEISIEPGRGVGDVDVQVFNEILLNPSSLRDDTPKKVENVIDMDIDLVSGEVYQLVTLSGHPAVPFKAP